MTADHDNTQSCNGRPPTKTMVCDDIQALLYDYLTHEIGRARGELIREHIRKCDACRSAAADIQATLNLLKGASAAEPKEPMSLSDDRRRRVWRAFMHPVLDWLYNHHVVVSIAIAIVAVIVTLFVIKGVSIIWKVNEDTDRPQIPPVFSGSMPTNVPAERGWYMIRDKDGNNWFYHPNGTSNRAGKANTGQ